VSKNTDKPLQVSNCHHAALELKDGEFICTVCKQRCTIVEHLVEDKANEEDDTR